MRTSGRSMAWLRSSLARWEVFLLFVLIGTFICGSHVSRYFLTSSNISIALAGMTPAAIVALPMTLIIVTGEIDISVGSIVGLCAAFMAVCLEHGIPVEVAMLLGIVVGTLAGFVNGLIVVYGGTAFPGRHHWDARVISRYCPDRPQGTWRKRFSGMVSKHWIRNDRRHADPVELVDLCLAVCWVCGFFARDSLGTGAVRHRQQSGGSTVLRD